MLDVTQRLIVIVGGGRVAVRKARGLIEAGTTRIRCVAPHIDADMPATVEQIIALFAPQHLHEAGLVFAATDNPTINTQIVQESRLRRIWVNRADTDEEQAGDFSTPAVSRRGDVIVTVSAAGSPFLATTIRDELASHINSDRVAMAAALQKLRPHIRSAPNLSIERRRQIFVDLTGDEAVQALRTSGLDGLLVWLRGRYPEIALDKA